MWQWVKDNSAAYTKKKNMLIIMNEFKERIHQRILTSLTNFDKIVFCM